MASLIEEAKYINEKRNGNKKLTNGWILKVNKDAKKEKYGNKYLGR